MHSDYGDIRVDCSQCYVHVTNVCRTVIYGSTCTTVSSFFSAVILQNGFMYHSLFLWQHCSLTPSPTVLLRMCTVSHPLPPHAHPALTIQPTVPHSLSMHKKLNCILPPTPLLMFLPGDHVLDRNITVANVSRLTMRGESSSDSIATVVRNGSVGFSFTNMVDLNIYSLAFTSYNRSWSYSSHPATSALLLETFMC